MEDIKFYLKFKFLIMLEIKVTCGLMDGIQRLWFKSCMRMANFTGTRKLNYSIQSNLFIQCYYKLFAHILHFWKTCPTLKSTPSNIKMK